MEELFPYQREGASYLASKPLALLADEMGLGKSAQAITAADSIGAKRILVLCPAAARTNWIREFQKFSKLSRSWTAITTRSTCVPSQNCVVSSYDLADPNNSNFQGPWDCLILDEGHLLKSVDTKRTKAVFGKEGLIRRSQRTWVLTGTPAPNHAGELWPLLFTFGVTTLPYQDFIDRYCDWYESSHGPRITGTKAKTIPELKKILSGIMLRRMKENVMKDLPPLFYQSLTVEAGPVDIEASFIQYVFPHDRKEEFEARLTKERNLIETVVDGAGLGSDGMRALESLCTSVSTLRRYTGLQKVKATAELIAEELENNAYEKVVIFAIHRDVIENLRVALLKFKPVTLYGGTEETKRQRNIDNFQKDPRYRVFIGNIQAAGTAITLTAAHHVVFIEQDWVPGNNAQAAMRCHRIGQTKPVTVRFISLADSIDERIGFVLKKKTKDLTAIFNETGLQGATDDDSSTLSSQSGEDR